MALCCVSPKTTSGNLCDVYFMLLSLICVFYLNVLILTVNHIISMCLQLGDPAKQNILHWPVRSKP
jgi:hypothetical protein